jgi:hypothetical protein
MHSGVTGLMLQEYGTPVTYVYFPHGRVGHERKCVMGHSSESGPVGSEGMLRVGAFLGRGCSGPAPGHGSWRLEAF